MEKRQTFVLAAFVGMSDQLYSAQTYSRFEHMTYNYYNFCIVIITLYASCRI